MSHPSALQQLQASSRALQAELTRLKVLPAPQLAWELATATRGLRNLVLQQLESPRRNEVLRRIDGATLLRIVDGPGREIALGRPSDLSVATLEAMLRRLQRLAAEKLLSWLGDSDRGRMLADGSQQTVRTMLDTMPRELAATTLYGVSSGVLDRVFAFSTDKQLDQLLELRATWVHAGMEGSGATVERLLTRLSDAHLQGLVVHNNPGLLAKLLPKVAPARVAAALVQLQSVDLCKTLVHLDPDLVQAILDSGPAGRRIAGALEGQWDIGDLDYVAVPAVVPRVSPAIGQAEIADNDEDAPCAMMDRPRAA